MAMPFFVQALLALSAFCLAAGLLLALFECFEEEALYDQALKQVESEVADVRPAAAVASEIHVSHGSQF